MKTYSRIYCLLLGLITSGIILNGQDYKTIHNTSGIEKPKNFTSRSDLSISIALPIPKEVIRTREFIEESKQKHDAVSDKRMPSATEAAATDSAYIYWWDTDWYLKYRIYYFFNALSIEIMQEKLNPDKTWTNYSQRVLEFFNTGYFRRETESYWKNSVSDWKIGYYEEYNTAGKLLEIYSKNWNDTTEEFTEGFRILSTYKKDTLLESELYQEWDVSSMGWENLVRINRSYNANDIITNSLQSIWKNNAWVNDYSIDYVFNEFGDLLSETTQVWDTVGHKWINDIQITRQYNSLGNITNILRKKWDNVTSKWVNDVNQVINYDEYFQVSINLVQTWNGSSWSDSLRTSYSYTDEGDISQYLEETWSGTQWKNQYREVYDYKTTEVTIKIDTWNSDGNAWENDILVTYTLDELGYIMVEQHDYWNSISSVYETGYYDKYDEDGTNPEYYEKIWNDTLNEFSDGVRFLNTYYANETRDIKQTIIQEWDTETSDWMNSQKTDYFWASWVSVQALSREFFKIYPIPFQHAINIEIEDEELSHAVLNIYDLHGRIVSEMELTGKKTMVELSYLKNGIYLAEINTDHGKSVIRIIKY